MKQINSVIKTDKIFRGENGKYYYFYCITNLLNNKKYWGVHSTFELNDGYKGSGRLLLKEMKIVPLENYIKEVLKFFHTEKEMYDYEKEKVTKDVVIDKNTYNLHTGGSGSWDFTTGRVTVKDENGNFFLVNIDDESYKNGIYKHNMVNMVHVIDENGQNITIDKETYYNNKDKYRTHINGNILVIENGVKKWMPKNEYDEKKKNGLVNGVTKGYGVFRDLSGNTFSCPIDDERVVNGELVGATKGLTVYKHRDDYTKIFHTTKDDPRVLSGELVGIRYGMINAINPITKERIMIPKNDKRLKSGELISIQLYLNQEKRKQGIKIGNGKKIITQKEYYDKYKDVIESYKNHIPAKDISLKTGYTIKKIRYIWNRYKNAPK